MYVYKCSIKKNDKPVKEENNPEKITRMIMPNIEEIYGVEQLSNRCIIEDFELYNE